MSKQEVEITVSVTKRVYEVLVDRLRDEFEAEDGDDFRHVASVLDHAADFGKAFK